MMIKNQNFWQTTRNAFNGVRILLSEKAAKREIFVLIASAILVTWNTNLYTVLIFVLSWLLLAVESLNTAIEQVCDMYSQAYDERIKSIKDVASAAIVMILGAQFSLLLLWALGY